MSKLYQDILEATSSKRRLLAVLIDPDKFDETQAGIFLKALPAQTTHIFVGGSHVKGDKTAHTVSAVKKHTCLPVILFPGNSSQITEEADALLFLSLISGRNPEYLIEQQVRSVSRLKNSSLEIIPTGYVLVDGGRECSVHRVSKTSPIPQEELETIINTSLAGQYSGKQLIYLEAGSGAEVPVSEEIISEVKKAIKVPLIVGGGIRSTVQLEKAFRAGADLAVIGTALETGEFQS